MNIQLEKLQRKPSVSSFQPVIIKLNKRDKLDEMLTNTKIGSNDEKVKENVIKQRILDKTNENVDRNELLKKFRPSQSRPVSQTNRRQRVINEMEVIQPTIPIPSPIEIEKKDEVLNDIIDSIERNRVQRITKEDIEYERENIQREGELELEQKLQRDTPGEQEYTEDVMWKTDNAPISFFPESVDTSTLPTIYETPDEDEETEEELPIPIPIEEYINNDNNEESVNKNTEPLHQENISANKEPSVKNAKKSGVKKSGISRTKTSKPLGERYDEQGMDTDLEEFKRMMIPLGGVEGVQRYQSYYLNNRKYFINFINNIFLKYRDQLNEERSMINCENIMSSNVSKFSLLLHQNLILDYLNIYTPYRGLLLYHGLGSGKTCSSIAIAEGFKTSRKVYIMLPASLEDNYLKEIKKCGDYLYKKNQHWKWISTDENPSSAKAFEKLLGVPREFLKKNKGAFFVDATKPPNYAKMSLDEKKILTRQIDGMIQNKYTFIHYNGFNKNKLDAMTENNTINPFDNSVVVIDEAHNFVSLIVNKLKITKPVEYDKNGNIVKEPSYLSLRLYELLLNAVNIRLVLLTGTPIINYPNEVGILFNILRGYIKTWKIPLTVENRKWTNDEIRELFKKTNNIDYLYYDSSSKTITITRNPHGFENVYHGEDIYNGVTNEKRRVQKNRGEITDESFISLFLSGLTKNNINFDKSKVVVEKYKALPDNYDEFMTLFAPEESSLGIQKKARGEKLLNTSKPILKQSKKSNSGIEVVQLEVNNKLEIKNSNLFKRRIIGLTSYFRSAQEELLPAYDRSVDYFVVKINMSDYQFKMYEHARDFERTIDKKSHKPAKTDIFKSQKSSYRIFSRLYCNFVMPTEIPRPVPFDTSSEAPATNTTEPPKTSKPARAPRAPKVPKASTGEPSTNPTEKIPKKRGRPKKVVGGSSGTILYENVDDENERDFEDKDNNFEDDEEVKEDVSDEDEDYIEPEIRNQNEDEGQETNGDIDENDDDDEKVYDEDGYDLNYAEQLKIAFREIESRKEEFLSMDSLHIYSPKFATMIETIKSPSNIGLNLVYSQFRTFEGIGLFTLALQVQGFAQFKIRKNESGEWDLDISEQDMDKPKYALYTGKEDPIEKDIIRNIYNGDWDGGDVPKLIVNKLKRISPNNNLGEIIKILMITASGSEGINLRNTRYVHIMEPYWNPIRIQQIIGRSRRICSHYRLPKNLQNVQVYIYVMQFSPKQKEEASIEMKLQDISKFNSKELVSTDEALYEITTIKETFNEQYIRAIKEASIDCSVYIDMNSKEGLKCMAHPSANKLEYIYTPDIHKDETDVNFDKNIYKITWKGVPVEINKKMYIMKKGDNPYKQELYDFENYKQKNLVLVGYAVKEKRDGRISPPYFLPI